MKTDESIQHGLPAIVFFQETKPDDIDKYFMQSNYADTSGGARDLRIRPSKKFWEALTPFFPNVISSRERSGKVFSTDKHNAGRTVCQTVSLWGPTNARDEVRIGKFYTIPGWEIDSAEFNTDHNAGITWFYLLVLDDKNQVWARTMRSSALDKNVPDFVASVKHSLAVSNGAKKTARGVYHFSQNTPTTQ